LNAAKSDVGNFASGIYQGQSTAQQAGQSLSNSAAYGASSNWKPLQDAGKQAPD